MIKANFNSYNSYVTDSLYQWDLNQVLTVNGLNLAVAPEVHFSNANTDRAIVRQAIESKPTLKVEIPNSLLQEPLTIYAHIGIYEGDTFKVIELIEIPVIARKRPSDYQIQDSDEEIYSFKALKNEIANMITLKEHNKKYSEITARIDNIIAHNNDTEGNTELLDIRVGTDGTIYGSAGEAIRQQLKKIKFNTVVDRLVYCGVYIDTVDRKISCNSLTGNSGKMYFANNQWGNIDDYSNSEIDYGILLDECLEKTGYNATWAYVIDPINKKFAFRQLNDNTDELKVLNTDIIILVGHFSASNGKPLIFNPIFYCNNIYMDGVLQTTAPVHISNKIIGATTGKIELDTVNKTLTLSGLFFFENGNWKNFSNPLIFDLTSYTVNSSGESIRILLNSNNSLEIRNINSEILPNDIFICVIFVKNSDWVFDKSRVFTQEVVKTFTYIDGVVMNPDIATLKTDVEKAKKTIGNNKTTCKIFKKVCCCGDSYTSGYIVDSEGNAHTTNEDYAYPHYMATMTGNEWINCGHSGANVLTWQTLERGLPKAQSIGKVQAYIIGLMINDTSSGTDRYVPIGTKDDIGTENQSYYGGMSAIIRELNAISPLAKIFVCTCPNKGDAFSPYNQAVYDIVDAYKNTYPVHCLDLLDNIEMYSNSSLTNDSHYGHYTAIGYEQFAEILSVIMSNYINDNIADFQDVAFIEYDE